jgi:hypothetical protein
LIAVEFHFEFLVYIDGIGLRNIVDYGYNVDDYLVE